MDHALLRHKLKRRAAEAAPTAAVTETSLQGILDAVDVDFAFAKQGSAAAPALPCHALATSLNGILDAVDVDFAGAMQGPAVAGQCDEAAPAPALPLHALEATPTPALPLHALETAPSPASSAAQDCLKGFAQKTSLTALSVDHVPPGQALPAIESPPRPVDRVQTIQSLGTSQSPPRPVDFAPPGQVLGTSQSPLRPVEHVLPGQALGTSQSPPRPVDHDRPRKAPKTTSPAVQYPWLNPLLPTHGMAGSALGEPEDFSAAVSALLSEISCPCGTLSALPAKKMDSDQPPPPPPPPSPELTNGKTSTAEQPVLAPSTEMPRSTAEHLDSKLPPPPPSPELTTGKTSTTEQPVLAPSTHVQRSTAEHLDSELPPPPPPPLPSSEIGTAENLASDQPVSVPSTEIHASTEINALSWLEVFTTTNPVPLPSTKIQAPTDTSASPTSWLEVLTTKNPTCAQPVSTPSRKIHRPSPQRPVSRSLIKKDTTTREDSMLLARTARQKWPSIKVKTTHMLQQVLESKLSSPVHDMFQRQLRAVKNGKAKDQKQALLAVLQYLHLQEIIMGKFAEDPFKDGFFGWSAFTVMKRAKFVDMLHILFAGLGYDSMCMAFRRCGFMVAPPHKFCHLMQGVGMAVWQQHQRDRYRAIS